jgi:hypothetical protein
MLVYARHLLIRHIFKKAEKPEHSPTQNQQLVISVIGESGLPREDHPGKNRRKRKKKEAAESMEIPPPNSIFRKCTMTKLKETRNSLRTLYASILGR